MRSCIGAPFHSHMQFERLLHLGVDEDAQNSCGRSRDSGAARSLEETHYFALEVQGSARLNRGHRNRVAAVTVARIANDPRV